MSGIVCAIRGGAASRPTIDQAIRTAKETGLPLFFLYVLNLDFLMHTSSARVQTITDELKELGEFILLSAQAQAQQQGVNAEGIIREGHVVNDEIVALCREKEADCVVLGLPQEKQEENIFTRQQLDQFSTYIKEETGAKVIYSTGDSL